MEKMNATSFLPLFNETFVGEDETSDSGDNGNGTIDVLGPRYHGRVRQIIIAVMIAFSLLGNSIVCWRLLLSRRRRYSKAKVLFLNLAIADLLVTLVTMTSQMVWEVMGRLWIAGDAFCRIFKLLQTFALVASIYILVSIALDRHYAIVTPLKPCPRPCKLAIWAWVTSLLPSVPNLLVFRQVQVAPGQCYCTSIFYASSFKRLHRQTYMMFVFMSVFIVPLLLLVGLYTRILLEIWRQSSTVKCRHQTVSSLPKAKIKTLKMTVVIFATFLVTNVPYIIQELILAFGDPNALDKNVVALFGVISASNSAANPYIYLTFHAKGSVLGKCCEFFKNVRVYSVSRWSDFLRSTVGGAARHEPTVESPQKRGSFSSNFKQSFLSSTRAMVLSQAGHNETARLAVKLTQNGHCPSPTRECSSL